MWPRAIVLRLGEAGVVVIALSLCCNNHIPSVSVLVEHLRVRASRFYDVPPCYLSRHSWVQIMIPLANLRVHPVS